MADLHPAVDYKPEVKKWLTELDAADKRERDWKKEGKRIVAIYEAEKRVSEGNHFNILFSNTETLLPALYNNTPRPVVERRHKDADPIGKVVADVSKRTLTYLMDTNDEDYTSFTDLIESAVLEALLPGRGVTRFKYEAAISGEGELAEVSAESVVGEQVPWDRIRMGYGKTWKQIPWLAFEHFMDREEVKKNFPSAEGVQFSIVPGKEGCDESDDRPTESDKEYMLAQVFEIWDKRSRKVVFVSPGSGDLLKSLEAPLNLSGFFPCPRPLQLIKKVSSTIPTPLYKLYEEQAEELNICTSRITRIMKAMKVRGFYDGTMQGLSELMNASDNTLLPAENVAAMLQGQTLDRSIWFFPIEKLVGVLQQLYTQREQIKSVIYEITGVSDILRGASRASETATAQNIKNQWGTLRLKRSQKEVMRYVRDCLRMMAEIAGETLSPETLAAMTGLQFPTGEQKQQAQAMLPQLQQVMQSTLPGPNGQPLPPDPQMQEQMAKLQAVLAKPSWDEILAVMQDDIQRQYKIDIETNSTVDAEATEDKTDVAEFLNSLSQFLNGVAPMIEQGYMSFEVAQTMLLAITRRFRFGTEVEDQIMEMQAPPPKQEAEDPKIKAEQAKLEMEQQRMQMEMAHAQQMQQFEIQREQAKMDLERQKMEFERELADMERQIKLQDMRDKAMMDQQQRAMQMQAAEDKAAIAVQQQADKGEPNANV